MSPRSSLALLSALFALVAVPGASAAPGTYFAGDALDGPSADVQRLGGLAVARDGGGAVTWIRRDGGVDHVYVSRLTDGAFAAPERIDATLAGAASQPVVAASDGGRLTFAFVSAGTLYAVVRPAGGGYSAPQPIAQGGASPAIAQSINGVAYLVYALNADVRAARLERNAVAFTGVDAPLDISQPNVAGSAAGRPRVAVAADGIATAVWGEAGATWARRIYESRLSTAPQQIAEGSDAPEIDTEDDSSWAWVVVRQSGSGAPRAIARRLVGSAFDPAVVVDGGEPVGEPRIDINGRGVGYATSGGLTSGAAFGAVLKDDRFNPAVALGGGGGAPYATPATGENGDGLIAFQQGAAGQRSIAARPYDYVAENRLVTAPGAGVGLSRAEFGDTDADLGLLAAADRVGNVVVAFVQGPATARRIVVATFDRAPASFTGLSSSGWRRQHQPLLKWNASADNWGPVGYLLFVDGIAVGTTGGTSGAPRAPLTDGLHRWQVAAVDRRGQQVLSAARNLRIDGRRPRLAFSIGGKRMRGERLRVRVKVSDASGTTAKASGTARVRVDFGDGSRVLDARSADHRYGHKGHFTVRVSAADVAGNVTVVKRRISVRG